MVPQVQQGDAAKTVAVIDIGSNSIRLVIAQVFADGHTELWHWNSITDEQADN